MSEEGVFVVSFTAEIPEMHSERETCRWLCNEILDSFDICQLYEEPFPGFEGIYEYKDREYPVHLNFHYNKGRRVLELDVQKTGYRCVEEPVNGVYKALENESEVLNWNREFYWQPDKLPYRVGKTL